MTAQPTKIQLASGLIGIGRPWGHTQTPVPSEEEVLAFLAEATKLGITYFDTAASYGTSEERVGKFLQTLSDEEKQKLTIATKFGDHWDSEKNDAYVDHSYEALKKSLDRSIGFLKQVDLLYLHKANMISLQSPDVAKSFEYAKEKGITQFGASVSDIESAKYVLNDNFYSVMQFPYNIANTTFAPIIDEAKEKGKIVVINRPFNMGKDATDKVEAFRFILEKDFNGFILTGTKSIKHLQENVEAFKQAQTL